MKYKHTFILASITCLIAGSLLALPVSAQTGAATPSATPVPPTGTTAQNPATPPGTAAAPQTAVTPETPARTGTAAASNELPKPKKAKGTELSNGVYIDIIKAADGEKPPPWATVQLHYIGMLEDGSEFDRSYAQKHAPIYKLADVIGCWQIGIPEMSVGSKAMLTCSPPSANGKRPVDFIPGNTTLYFIVELVRIVRQ